MRQADRYSGIGFWGLATLLIAAAPASGCWTTAEQGQRMALEAQARDARIVQLESQSRTNQEQLATKIAELEAVLEKATAILHRSSADAGAQVERLGEQQASLDGRVAELTHKLETLTRDVAGRVAALEQRAGPAQAKQPLRPEDIPKDPEGHFAAAYEAYKQADYARARALFEAYLTGYPKDERAGNAQYWIGAAFTQENKPATALGEYRKVIANHGRSPAVNVALYGMGDAFYRLHACQDASDALKALLKRGPKPGLRERTEALLKTIAAAGDSYCTS